MRLAIIDIYDESVREWFDNVSSDKNFAHSKKTDAGNAGNSKHTQRSWI